MAQANGLDLTFVGSNPTFRPGAAVQPAAEALQASVMVSSIAPYASDAAGADSSAEAFATEFPASRPHFVLYGYAQGELMAQILETACENGALTREGLQEAFQSLDDVDTRASCGRWTSATRASRRPARSSSSSPTPPSTAG